MRKYLLLLILLMPWINWGQINPYAINWDTATTVGWTSTGGSIFNLTSVLPCQGSQSIRARLYSDDKFNNVILKSGNLGATKGGLITLTYDYKWLLNNGNIIINPVGAGGNKLDLKWQWSNYPNGPWYTFSTIDVSNHVVSTSCRNVSTSFTPYQGTSLYVRVLVSNTTNNDDNFIYLDNVNISEGAVPTCKMPIDVTVTSKTATSINFEWKAPTPTPVSYDWEVRESGEPGTPGAVASNRNVTQLTAGATGLTGDKVYKIYVRANCSSTDSSLWIGIDAMTFCNFPTLTVSNYNVCGIQDVRMNVTSPGRAFWFDESGALVHQGTNSYTEPMVTESRKFDVFSGVTNSTSNQEIIIGTGVGTETPASPFKDTKANKAQYIYQASELRDAGFSKGIIKTFGFRLGNTGGTLQRNNFTIHMGLTALDEFVTTDFIPNNRLTAVKNAGNKLLVAGQVNWVKLDRPFIWDGFSNIVVQITYSDVAAPSLASTQILATTFTSTGSNRALYSGHATNSLNLMYDVATGTRSVIRMNGYFDILDGCFGEVKTVNVTYKDAPDLILSSNTVNNCVGSPNQTIYALTGANLYDTYEWSITDTNDPAFNDKTHPDHPDNAIVGDQNIGWTFSPTKNISYTLKASNTGGEQCVLTQDVTVEINPTPQMLQLQNDYTLCFNDIQELKVDNFTNEKPIQHSFNGNMNGVSIANGNAGDAIVNETSLFSEGNGSLKVTHSAQTNATVNFATSINMMNAKSIVVEFDHIAVLQANSTSVMDYGYVEYSIDNGATWKPFAIADYTGGASTTLPMPVGQTGFQGMFFTKTSYADWNGFGQSTIPTNTAWKSEKLVVPASEFTGTGTFKVRFRIGADGNTQYTGWYIDNVRLTPINKNTVTWTPVANLYYDQNATVPYDGLVNAGTLYLKGTSNSLNVPYKVELTSEHGCKASKDFNVTIGLKESPVVHDINNCGIVNVANTNFVKNPDGVLSYFDSPTSNVPITQITTSGVYYVEQLISGCKSNRVAFTVVISPNAPVPTGSQSQVFCTSSTVNDLQVNAVSGFQIKWYSTPTGGSQISGTTPIASGDYYGEFDNGICFSSSRLKVSVVVGVKPNAIAINDVYICGISTIADIKLPTTTGATGKWYQNINDANSLPSTTVLNTGVYYISQVVGGCESTRTAVNVSTVQNLTMPTAATIQTFCGSATVGDLLASGIVNGATPNWYSFSTSDTPLANSTPLTSGTYYVGQSIGECDSPRKAVSVRLLSVNAPVINPISICGDATVSSIPFASMPGVSYKVYATSFATVEMNQNDVVKTGTYYVSKVETGCETAKAAVQITVTPRPLAPTGNTNQTFVNYAEVKELKTNETNVIWFASYNDAVNNQNQLPIYTPLQDGKTYYGVLITTNGCASLPIAVTVTITLGVNDLDLASLKYYPNPVDSELTVSYKETIQSIEVYDVLGKKVKTQKFDANEVKLNISQLSAGTYMVKVFTQTGSQFVKIVKR
ncbi:T9SS type A sorting domain-containing protein [Flavobacterium sp. xlx-214]|uniref:T9SS type A sorting domain-containing protein n=1 Tax=unclassified Flavobacterium TaxID=196869 RepID=UPI0013D1EAC7|nr:MULTISPECIES: T9SS type A sorting domain-containing protein [unclassified Flavobacterium]MBA5794103.1 T9SS type A sorting domain-containing protein [Flavobacterium sp. xlx-221]QMI84012.1 T9SS type A sorting domain-containing protein [Flavobacterium sp. xlx-214]